MPSTLVTGPSGDAARARAGSATVADWFRALRVNQWTKNLVVAAAAFFAYWDRTRANPLPLGEMVRVVPSTLLFCLVSSAVYIMNDLRDAESDRRHPVKRRRPIAAGRIDRRQAMGLAALIMVAGIGPAMALSIRFAAVLYGYAALQIVYTFALKRVALVDVIVIGSGFVLRAIGGAVVFEDVGISPWLLLCAFLLALFLGLCKRRHEKILLGEANDGEHRASLRQYETQVLDQLIAVVGGATIIAYSIYTLWPGTVEKFGSARLGFTIPFVVFGVFRYLDLVYRHEKGGSPETVLLTDGPLLGNLFLYAVSTLLLLHFG